MEYVIADLIWERKKNLSWHGLENAICEANRERLAQLQANGAQPAAKKTGRSKARSAKAKAKSKTAKSSKPPKPTIDRRKLQDLAERKPNVSLSQHELELLDTFFIRHGGPGLAEIPLFRRNEDLFRVLKVADRVSFFVGVRFVTADESEVVARWDVSALLALQHLPDNVDTEAFVVPTRDVGRQPDKKEWATLLAQAAGNVNASIGSPIACAGSERLMAQMFGIPPYTLRPTPPPVCFAHANANVESAFVRRPTEVAGMKTDGAALLVDGKAYVAGRKGAEYGVVMAQRTGHEHAAFVIAGISGPGTFAAANFFADGQISVALPRFSRKERQPIVVAIVSTDIRRADVPTDRRIDRRAVANTRLAARPLIFEHIKGAWEVTSEQG